MLKVKVEKNNVDKAIKAMRFKVYKTRQLRELRERKAFKKKSIRKKEELRKAIYKAKWLEENGE